MKKGKGTVLAQNLAREKQVEGVYIKAQVEGTRNGSQEGNRPDMPE